MFVMFYKVGNQCNFFEWYDQGEVSGWPKRALIEARDEIQEKRRLIAQLTSRISELEKREVDTPSTDNEGRQTNDKEKEIGLESKLVNLEAKVHCQSMITTGLIVFSICVIVVVLFLF